MTRSTDLPDVAPLLDARGLVKHLGGRRVVDGVDLACHEGQVLGLLGPNGAGKTTTLRMLYAAFIRMHYQRTWEGQLTSQIELRHVVWGEVLWAALLAMIYVAIVALVLTGCRLAGIVELDLRLLPLVLPLSFVAACGFAALGLCFTALVPTIDHMNVPVFLVVLPLAFVSGTYFPLAHPALRQVALANPLYHLAEGYRCLLLGAPAAGHLAGVMALAGLMVLVLVPLDLRLLRRRVLGEV